MIVLATRGSPLALWQAEETRRLLLSADATRRVELLTVASSGDKDARTELANFGRTGIFTAEVDDAVLSNRATAGVHSLKDVPTTLPEGLMLAGVLARGGVEDVLVSRNGKRLVELPRGARIATGSVRRAALLRNFRPDLQIVAIRGNVDTRLAKLDAGAADAIVLARAGLERLGLEKRISEILPRHVFVPAPSQGIVGLVARRGDADALRTFGSISDVEAFAEAIAERTLLHRLHGGCNAPIGAHARAVENAIQLHACVLGLDGAERIEERGSAELDDAAALAEDVAERLLARGAKRLVDAARGA